MKLFPAFYLTNRFFIALAAVIGVFCFGLLNPAIFLVAQGLLGVLVVGVVIESVQLFSVRQPALAERQLPTRLSNGDDNVVHIGVTSFLPFITNIRLLEDLPEQLQLYTWKLPFTLDARQKRQLTYTVTPVTRGNYRWQNTYLFLETNFLRLVSRRCDFENDETIPCYPSFEQFKSLKINALVNQSNDANDTMIQKIGQSLEFEQIKNYVAGDDFRHINWKASAKQGKLMLNQYRQERSQDIYCVLDTSRNMQQAFRSQQLLDYSVNAALALSKAVLATKDKAGVLTFSANDCVLLPPRSEISQFKRINEMLYSITPEAGEAGYERLYRFVRSRIRQRSLLVFFTHFDTIQSLQRNLPYLRAMAKYHLLLVVIFEDDELATYALEPAENLREIYNHTMAANLLYQNRQKVAELTKHGILSLTTQPDKLSLPLINRFLAIKKRQMI